MISLRHRGGACACAFLLVCLLSACGNEEPGEVPEIPDHWGVTIERDYIDGGPHGRFEGVPLRPPEARTGSPDDWDGRRFRRLVLNLMPDGEITFKTYVFRLSTDGPDERDEALDALGEAMTRVTDRFAQDGKPVEALMLHFDRSCMWRDARECTRTAIDARLPSDRLQLAVRAPATDRNHVLEMRLSSAVAGTAQAIQVHLGRAEDGASTLRLGERSWSFPPGDDFNDAGFLVGANKRWAGFEREVRSLRAPSAAAVTVADEVRWAYVVKLLDIMLETTCSTFRFPASGFTLSAHGR